MFACKLANICITITSVSLIAYSRIDFVNVFMFAVNELWPECVIQYIQMFMHVLLKRNSMKPKTQNVQNSVINFNNSTKQP